MDFYCKFYLFIHVLRLASRLLTCSSLLTSPKIEGSYTVATAIYFMVSFPKSPDSPVSLTGIRWFTEKEAHILQNRVFLDDPAKAQGRRHVSWAELKRTVRRSTLLPTLCTWSRIRISEY